MLTLSELKNYTLAVYLSPVLGCKKPSLWIESYNKMIKLASFIDAERAQLFIDYWEEKGIPIEVYDLKELLNNE